MLSRAMHCCPKFSFCFFSPPSQCPDVSAVMIQKLRVEKLANFHNVLNNKHSVLNNTLLDYFLD